MNTAAKNAEMASAMSFHLTSFREAAIMQPTITSTPAVAADGTAETTGARNADKAKQIATTTEVRPVRPPAAMPAEDYVGGGVRGAADGADGGGDGVGEQGLVHLGGEAVAVLQSLLHPRRRRCRCGGRCRWNYRGVRTYRTWRRRRWSRSSAALGRIRERCREALGGEDRAEGLRQLGEGLADGLRVRPGGLAERDADYGGDGDGQPHVALNLHHGEHNGQYEADQEDPQHLVVEVGQTLGSRNGTALGGGLRIAGSELDQADVQHAHVGHEQADAAADGVLQGLRDGQDDHLADLGDGDEDVDQAAQEHHAHGLLPAEAEAEAHGVGEERVEAHAGGLGVRHVGEQAHDQGADDGRDDGGQEHAAPRHTRLRQDLRVDDDDVSHREERGQAGQNLSRRRSCRFPPDGELLHFFSTSFGFMRGCAPRDNAAARPGENCDSP